jgi:hypothetical protein
MIYDKPLLIERYAAGDLVSDMARDQGISRVTLHRKLRRWGITPRGKIARAQTISIPNSPVTLAYAAGIVDGEGTIGVVHQGGRRRPMVTVTVVNTSREVIDWFTSEFGGKVYLRNNPRFGSKQIYTWTIARLRDVQAFLQAIRPYLIIKKITALNALRVVAEVIKAGYTE